MRPTNFFTYVFAAAIGAVGMTASSAHASFVTYDFVNYIDTVAGEHGVVADFNISDTTNSESLTITAHGTNFNVVTGTYVQAPFAYFDGGGAGIGVCQVLSATQCDPSNDDNITITNNNREILSLAFNEEVMLTNLLFRNDGHNPTFGQGSRVFIAISDGTSDLANDMSDFTSYLLEDGLSGVLGANLIGLPQLDLAAGQYVHIMYDNQQIYLAGLTNYPVSAPATLSLFVTALAGLGFMARRRKAALR